jgi:hypothetical protein
METENFSDDLEWIKSIDVTPKDLYGKNIKELEPYIYNI